MQKDAIQLTSPILGAGAKAGAVDVAAAATRLGGGGNSLSIPLIEPQSAEAFRRRSLCSIDQPGVVMSKLPQGEHPATLLSPHELMASLCRSKKRCIVFCLPGARSIFLALSSSLWEPLLTVARFCIFFPFSFGGWW